MSYYVETEINAGTVFSRMVVYNFKLCKWQPKMTNNCVTKSHEEAERVRSTRALINKNTKIYMSVDVE